MWKHIKKCILHLRADESGQIIVLVCVFMVAVLVFAMSVMNIGHISNEKIKLQNAADFAALNAATWQARAMNMEGLFNTTVTADMVLQVARSLVTGVPPDEMPPNWIQLQQSAQDWLQQSFNRRPNQNQLAGGFGTEMAGLAGRLNGNFQTETYPPRIPLYVYRYRFFDADYEVNPVVGAKEFAKRSKDDNDYIPAKAGHANQYYTSGALPFSQAEPDAPDELGYVVWEHNDTLGEKNNIIWPKATDEVMLYSGDPGKLNGEDLYYNLGKNLSYPQKQQMLESLRTAIYNIIDDYGTDNNLLDEEGSIVNVLRTHVENNLNISPDSDEFEKLFVYDAATSSNGGELDLIIENGKPYKTNQSRDPATSTSEDPVIGHLVIHIIPHVKVGVFPKEAKAPLIENDYQTNDPYGQIPLNTLMESSNSVIRWYDKIAAKEFWNLRTTEFDVVQIGERAVYKTVTVSTEFGSYSSKVIDYWLYQYIITCSICRPPASITVWRKSKPSNSSCLSLLGSSHKSYSDLQPSSERHHQGNCVQRCWWYYAFGVEFNVTVKAYMNLDFSTLLMAKYTSSTDPKQLERAGNVRDLEPLVHFYKDSDVESDTEGAQRNIAARCTRPAQDLTFGKSFFTVKPENIPDNLKENASDLADGTVPKMHAFSSAKHLQRGEDGEDITESGDDLFFGMNWYSIPTNPKRNYELLFDD